MKTISEIVHTKYNGKVASVNANGQIEYKRVVGWSKIRNSNKRMGPIKNWVKLNTTSDNNTKAKLKCTDDHRVFYTDDIFNPSIDGFTEAKNMAGRFAIRAVDVRDNNHRTNALYSKEQVSFMVGTLLGDSYISKNSAMVCSHGDNQLEYLQLKQKLFG